MCNARPYDAPANNSIRHCPKGHIQTFTEAGLQRDGLPIHVTELGETRAHANRMAYRRRPAQSVGATPTFGRATWGLGAGTHPG